MTQCWHQTGRRKACDITSEKHTVRNYLKQDADLKPNLSFHNNLEAGYFQGDEGSYPLYQSRLKYIPILKLHVLTYQPQTIETWCLTGWRVSCWVPWTYLHTLLGFYWNKWQYFQTVQCTFPPRHTEPRRGRCHVKFFWFSTELRLHHHPSLKWNILFLWGDSEKHPLVKLKKSDNGWMMKDHTMNYPIFMLVLCTAQKLDFSNLQTTISSKPWVFFNIFIDLMSKTDWPDNSRSSTHILSLFIWMMSVGKYVYISLWVATKMSWLYFRSCTTPPVDLSWGCTCLKPSRIRNLMDESSQTNLG